MVGKKQRNVDFIRINDYNKNKKWRKYVGLTKTSVVLKYDLFRFSCEILEGLTKTSVVLKYYLL